jgi:hypothetical protein
VSYVGVQVLYRLPFASVIMGQRKQQKRPRSTLQQDSVR